MVQDMIVDHLLIMLYKITTFLPNAKMYHPTRRQWARERNSLGEKPKGWWGYHDKGGCSETVSDPEETWDRYVYYYQTGPEPILMER